MGGDRAARRAAPPRARAVAGRARRPVRDDAVGDRAPRAWVAAAAAGHAAADRRRARLRARGRPPGAHDEEGTAMTTRVDVEEIETTKGEKLLATILTGFLLVGVLWVYFHVDVDREHPFREPGATLSAGDRAALAREDRATSRVRRAVGVEHVRRRVLIDRREAYRTALDEGSASPGLKQRYQRAQSKYTRAQQERRAAARERAAARPAADAA